MHQIFDLKLNKYIFDQRQKLYLGLDVQSEVQILNVIY